MANIVPIFLNGVYSTVQAGSSAIGSSSATGVNVASGDGAAFGTIGTNQYIPAVVLDTSTSPETIKEYVYITARSTDTLTVVRQAQDSTRFAASTTSIQAGYTIAAVYPSQELGDAWKSGGGDYFRSGYYSTGMDAESAGSQAPSGGYLIYRPFIVPVRRTFDRIGINVVTGVAGGLLRMGVYSGSGRPETLLLDAGTVAATTSGAKEITISLTLAPGVVWVAIANQGTADATVTYLNNVSYTRVISPITAPLTAAKVGVDYYQGSVTGALPSSATPTHNEGGTFCAAICLRAA